MISVSTFIYQGVISGDEFCWWNEMQLKMSKMDQEKFLSHLCHSKQARVHTSEAIIVSYLQDGQM